MQLKPSIYLKIKYNNHQKSKDKISNGLKTITKQAFGIQKTKFKESTFDAKYMNTYKYAHKKSEKQTGKNKSNIKNAKISLL